jgi:hypothetical protein
VKQFISWGRTVMLVVGPLFFGRELSIFQLSKALGRRYANILHDLFISRDFWFRTDLAVGIQIIVGKQRQWHTIRFSAESFRAFEIEFSNALGLERINPRKPRMWPRAFEI